MDWKEMLKNVAPVIGGAIGGPFGSIGMKFLAGKLLGDEGASEEDIANAVMGASPEQLANLRKWDNDFKLEMAKLGFKEKELHAHDRDSARKMAMSNGMMPQIVLASIYTAGYFALLYQFMTGTVVIAAESKAEFNMVLGVMTAAQVQIMNFFFGSSSGSKEKTARLSK